MYVTQSNYAIFSAKLFSTSIFSDATNRNETRIFIAKTKNNLWATNVARK